MLTIDLNHSSRDVISERNLQMVTDVMLKAKKTIVVTGAGISCSSGIPDFRSADGLYNLVKKQYPKTVLKGKDLFDANLFRDCATTAVFYTFISELHAQTLKAKPSPTHHFIKMLSERGKLLRCYTQNIDCLEEELGMETNLVCEKGKVKKDVNVVQLHGSLRKLKCTICSEPYGFLTDYEKVFREGEAPDCPKCELNDVIRVAQGKRKVATGTLRPDIVLYNENHPFGDAIGRIQLSDLQKSPDVLLVMGTSLKVHGLRLLVRKAAKSVHENKRGCVILVNKTPVVGKEWSGVFDYFIEGECDRWCHIVQDALRKVKVQTKLPFKALTPAQVEKQKQTQEEEKQEQEQSSDKENFVPVDHSKKQKSTSKKRPFSVMSGKKISEEVASESIQAALGALGLGNSSSSRLLSSSPACLSNNNSNIVININNNNNNGSNGNNNVNPSHGRVIATCKKRTRDDSSHATSITSSPPPSPKKQNTLTGLHVSKATLRRPVLAKSPAPQASDASTKNMLASVVVDAPKSIAERRRTRSNC
ncbi:hypothetical protein BGX21_000769 [Mortierella sp. AD011]|nr:hypothetical protein BGX20_010974 [Mortierella sp. AD010]KAF9386553.1 hypothetical protein BGX21_000769 [Mortierella sp. AD011]